MNRNRGLCFWWPSKKRRHCAGHRCPLVADVGYAAPVTGLTTVGSKTGTEKSAEPDIVQCALHEAPHLRRILHAQRGLCQLPGT